MTAKAILERKSFEQALKRAMRFSAKGANVSPILSYMQIGIDGNTGDVLLNTTNMDEWCFICIQAEGVEGDGIAVVPIRNVYDIVRMANSKIVLEVNDKTLAVGWGNTRTTFELRYYDESDFPQYPKFEMLGTLYVSANELKRAIKRVLFAVSDDEARPAMNGVNLHVEDEHLFLVGTDGYRLTLARVEAALENAEQTWPNHRWIIPYEAAKKLVDTLDDGVVRLSFGETTSEMYSHIGADDVEIVIQNIDENYPRWQQIVEPARASTKIVELPAKPFEHAMKMIKRVTETGTAVMTVHEKKAVIVGETKSEGMRTETAIDCVTQMDVEEFTIGYSADFMLDLLKVVLREQKDARLRFQLGEPNEVFRVMIVGDDSFEYIVMPRNLKYHRA